MRAFALLLALVLAAPVAAASSSNLEVAAPAEAVAGETLDVTVRLTLDDIWCHDGAEFTVTLEARGDAAGAEPVSTLVRFTMDDQPHFMEPWSGEASVPFTFTLAGGDAGTVAIIARFSTEAEGCFAPDRVPPAEASASVSVRAAPVEPAPPEQPPAQEPPADAPPAQEPPAANDSPGDPSSPPASNGTADPQESTGSPPTGSPVGAYEPPAEQYVAVPGVSVAALVAVALALALARRKA